MLKLCEKVIYPGQRFEIEIPGFDLNMVKPGIKIYNINIKSRTAL